MAVDLLLPCLKDTQRLIASGVLDSYPAVPCPVFPDRFDTEDSIGQGNTIAVPLQSVVEKYAK